MKWISLVTLLLISTNVFSYKFTQDVNNGTYWQSFPINLSIFLGDESERELLEKVVRESELEWEKATATNLWQVSSGVVTTKFQDNFIRWSDNFEEETGFDGEYTLAVTIRYTRVPYITKMEIILNGNLEYLRNNENNTLKKTILHEMGHSLGLDHSTPTTIMNSYITGLTSLQDDDKLGALTLVNKMVDSQKKSVATLKPTSSSDTNAAMNNINACGSVTLINGDHGGGGAGGFVGSLFLGLMMIFILKTLGSRKNLPIRFI